MRLTLKPVCFFIAAILLFSSCKPGKKNISDTLNTGCLPSISYSVDVNRDTVLQTPDGAFIHIPAQALDAGGATTVKLEIREAISISEMIRAGLLTQTDGKPLSSGGMIQIKAAEGQSVKIVKSIGVSIPTNYIDLNMQLYKGVSTGNTVTNWTDPQPLIKNNQTLQIDTGKQLFVALCATCHAVDKRVVAPELAYISRLRDHRWLYDYTRNSKGNVDTIDRYAHCLYSEYGKTPMPEFGNLSDGQISAIYNYIDNESKRRALPMPADYLKKCVDSCIRYEEESGRLMNLRHKLINDNGSQVEVIRTPAPDTSMVSAPSASEPDNYIPPRMLPKVNAPYYKAVYYQFSIQTFGWYNIDVLVSETDGAKKSELILRLQGSYTSEINVFLILPSSKVFQQGGPLAGKENAYGFYTVDGSIYLQQSVKATVMAMGERDGKLLFDMASFQTSEKQNLTLSPVVVTKDQMNSMIKTLDLPDINMQIQDSKNVKEIKAIDGQLNSLEALKPKTCDCNCGSEYKGENIYMDSSTINK